MWDGQNSQTISFLNFKAEYLANTDRDPLLITGTKSLIGFRWD